MVVCKCRKATKLYCFVHKVPVCGQCICFPEHQICVVNTYSQWVIDGEYDWPSKCCQCQATLENGADSQTTRLGCLHIIHTSCLVSHIKSYPQHTAPAGYVCPACSTSIWPPKSIKDSGSNLHSKLKEAILQTGLEKSLFGNHSISLLTAESYGPPPAFASDPLKRASSTGDKEINNYISLDKSKLSSSVAKGDNYSTEASSSAAGIGSSEFVEVNGSSLVGNQFQPDQPNFIKSPSSAGPGATTRKSAFHLDMQNSGISYYDDDEDATQKKYSRRGSFRHKFLRSLLPIWSSALPTLPVTAPPRKDASNIDDIPEVRSRHQRSSRMDLRKILLLMAITACLATMAILYYKITQHSLEKNLPDDEMQ